MGKYLFMYKFPTGELSGWDVFEPSESKSVLEADQKAVYQAYVNLICNESASSVDIYGSESVPNGFNDDRLFVCTIIK